MLFRSEAVTGENTVSVMQTNDALLGNVATLVGAKVDDVVSGVERKLDELRQAQDEVKALRARLASGRAVELAANASGGVVVERMDGVSANDLRDLAVAVRQQNGVKVVVLCGITDTGGVSLVSAVAAGVQVGAGELIKEAAQAVGGGGGGKGDVATAGGKNPAGIDEALRIAGEKARNAGSV